jgi:hypothetical protein
VKYIVTKVKAGIYQNEEYIFPVLVVYSKRLPDEIVKTQPEQVLIINLVKNLNIKKKTGEIPIIKPEKQKGE